MNKNIQDYIDSYGMVVTKFDRDGGDSCAHGCAIIYAMIIMNVLAGFQPEQYIQMLRYKNTGRFRRHPDPTKWYSNIDTLSRDQFTPLLALLGLIREKRTLWALFFAHLRRGLLFAWNVRMNAALPGTPEYKWKLPDLTGPEIWAMWIRAFRFYPLYPLLYLFDLQTLVGSAIYRLKLSQSTLQMNQVIITDFSTRVMPTPVSLLARRIYGKKTPSDAIGKSWGPEWQPPVDTYLLPLIAKWP